MLYQKLLSALFVILLFTAPKLGFGQTVPKLGFKFTLENRATTSAGVYNSEGTLVRTLWSGVSYEAGAHKAVWDGKDDFGKVLPPDGNYSAKILSNNVKYEWEGVIGNSSTSFTGPSVHRALDFVANMAISGSHAYAALGYGEVSPAQEKFSLSEPQKRVLIHAAEPGANQSSKFVATDGSKVFWVGSDPFANEGDGYINFVFATHIKDDKQVIFSKGRSYDFVRGTIYPSVIDVVNNSKGTPTGLAVQRNGNYLFVARKSLNEIHVLDKMTGALVQTITSVTSPRGLAVDRNDKLWIISGRNTVSRYTVNSNGTLAPTSLSLNGLVDPLSLGISPDNNTIVVCDGGMSQQLKAFSNSTGSSSWTFGTQGGYLNSPNVTNDKFYFNDERGVDGKATVKPPFICFQPDGSFWVSDPGTYRIQHYTATRTFIDRISYLPRLYSTYVDANDPTRVFGEFLEFAVDYSKPLDNGKNGSWKLVRNWRRSVPKDHFTTKVIFKSVVTLSNRKTYALLFNTTTRRQTVVELSNTSGIRLTGIDLGTNDGGFKLLWPDGSLVTVTGSNSFGGTQRWNKRALSGFDASGNPIWGAPSLLAATAATTSADPVLRGAFTRVAEPTSSNILVSFNSNATGSTGYHLGGIKIGGAKWLWKTALNTHRDYRGEFPKAEAFDIGNGSKYQGTPPLTMDRNIFWGFFGEFWKSSQTNKWNHIYDNGLPVGQFGITGPEVKGQEAPAMMAGNAFSPALTKVGGDYYLYHNDEGQHAGVHRWRISGLKTIHEQTANIEISEQQVVSEGLDLMSGLPTNSILTDGTQGWNRSSKNEDYTDKYRSFWSVKTSIKSYKSVDLFIKYRQPEAVYKVSRNLGINDDVVSWNLTGKITWEGNYANQEGGGSYLEVLDDAGKVITRFFNKGTDPSVIYGNRKIIAQGLKGDIKMVTSQKQPISITFNRTGATFKFANYPSVTTSIFDATANWKSPATMRVYFWTTKSLTNYNLDRVIGLDNMKFSITASSATTIDAPTVVGDDVDNILTASHALGSSNILVSENNGPFTAYPGEIYVGNVARPAGYWRFKVTSIAKKIGSGIVNSPAFYFTPLAPLLTPDDSENTLKASHELNASEIEVSVDNAAFGPYVGQIDVKDVTKPAGYWKFRIRSSFLRTESEVVNSPEFTVTPPPPSIRGNDAENTLSASHELGSSEILVSINNQTYKQYEGQIVVGDRSRALGWWKFKIKSAAGRSESAVVYSRPFNASSTTASPNINGNDEKNTLTASHNLGTSEIVVSENNGSFRAYSGTINVGNVDRPFGYWKFKTKGAQERYESAEVKSPAFTFTTTPKPPILVADDKYNTLRASHEFLYFTQILVSENNGDFKDYTGKINVYNIARPKGYWKFKTEAGLRRNESEIVESPAFTFSSTPAAPNLSVDDKENTISASHILGSSEIVVSENNGTYRAYTGKINVGNVARPFGYWKFKIKAAAQRLESKIAQTYAFTITTTPNPPVLTADDVNNTLIASHDFLYFTQLLVSENNGDFKAYTGKIQVYNVARPAGYWKFKTVAGTRRNESAVVASPAFTAKAYASRTANSNKGSNDNGTPADNKSSTAASTTKPMTIKESKDLGDITVLNPANSLQKITLDSALTGNTLPGKEILKSTASVKQISEAEEQKVTIFPNPITDNTFSIRLINYTKGKYLVTLRNTSGNVIMTRSIDHMGKTSIYPINIQRSMNAGMYFVEVSGNSTSTINKLFKN